ncbi:hypothetical protein BJD12_10110 [Xanthomonas vesicatoria ATCC 35937]|uniref:Uncharacterized protein n=1 Tax=Xanthomonas vesicatoria ATCC 35937 TaxID=925775 RepID=F0B7H0_9XANT|nr:hypothetical protein [Xanthomonas vesicatoria]APP75545.1 hypothetical protein BJD12_10110 [Xanthomonas vesicatoria ATCC 35937]EGD11506.1 hypothetical protein XVE_0013 [Xanthomonas vesicatoria ATCC 35937]KTF36069.1 hypothetical protein LMG920_00470 [Xanthomonas vesicatoria]MCC8599172.1 hypothetical protein [Xanthomonas vesicatoria]MCC8603838.1 hypothetical protein [Xanthomonas vesicatoria]
MNMLSVVHRAALAVALGLVGTPLAAAELEEEIINPSEVTFREGQPYYDDAGDYVRLRTRKVDGEIVYFRTVRFDREQGYVDAHGESIATLHSSPTASDRGSAFSADRYTDVRYVGAYGGYGDGGELWFGASRNRPSGQVYYGNGLYGPDPYSSPHNRDARQRYIGPGYVGSCDLSGCREVHAIGFYELR